MHGSPCQDISLAGLQAGADKGTNTRSSLMYESIRIIEKLKPKYVVWENVKNLLSKKHKHNFDSYIDKLDKIGYNSYYQVLNAKDYGIPQNRERVYTISIRKDINEKEFKFPKKEPLKIVLKDLLEKEVDEKYYLNDKQLLSIKNSTYMSTQRRIQEKKWCDTLCARDFKGPKCVRSGSITSSSTVCINTKTKIRKLTPKECWKLMGFNDEDFYKAKNSGVSNSQLYKQARKFNLCACFRKNIYKFVER